MAAPKSILYSSSSAFSRAGKKHNRNRNSNGTYELILEYLIDYLEKDDTGKMILHTPSFLVVKNNEIIFFDSLERIKANMQDEDYWTDYNYNLKKAYIEAGFNNYLGVTEIIK